MCGCGAATDATDNAHYRAEGYTKNSSVHLNNLLAVVVPIRSIFAIRRQEAPWLRNCRTCSCVTLTRGRPIGFFVPVSDRIIAKPQQQAPGGHMVRPRDFVERPST